MSQRIDIWARRKASVAAEAAADEAAVEQAEIAEVHAELEEKTDAEILVELELPDPDKMKMGDDFTGFMKAAVPERIRKRALRKLWLSNPVLANVDNLLDYGEDFTGNGVIGEVISTTYQVGKGMLAHVKEMERQAAAEAEAEAAAENPEVEAAEPVAEENEAAEIEAEIEAEVAEIVSAPEYTFDEDVEEETPLVKRRMHFAFAS